MSSNGCVFLESMISIIVPVYKSEKYLSKCVLSILNQTYANIEIILVDDGSPDDSGSICDEYAQKDSRVRVVHKKNGGVSSARNAGLRIATGDFIQFVDSDDCLELNMCELLIGAAIKDKTDLVICGYKMDVGTEIKKICPNKNSVLSSAAFASEIQQLYKNWLLNNLWNKLFKRSLIDFLFNEELSLGEDQLFNINYLRKVEAVSIIADTLYIYDANVQSSLTKIIRTDLVRVLGYLYNTSVSLLRSFYGVNFNVNIFTEIYVVDVFNAIGRHIAYSTKSNKKLVLLEIAELASDNIFFEAAKRVSFNSKQREIAFRLLSKKRVKSVYYLYKLLNKVGKIY